MKKTILFAFLLVAMTANAQDNKTKVFATSGAKYHLNDSCQYVKNSPSKKQITLDEAKKQGKTICKRCEAKANKSKQK